MRTVFLALVRRKYTFLVAQSHTFIFLFSLVSYMTRRPTFIFQMSKNSDLNLTNQTASKALSSLHLQPGKKRSTQKSFRTKNILFFDHKLLSLSPLFCQQQLHSSMPPLKTAFPQPNSKVSPKKLPQKNHFSTLPSSQCSFISISTQLEALKENTGEDRKD